MEHNAQHDHPSGLSDEQIADLCQRAAVAAQHSYSPYSRFRVGAALLLDTGKIVTGTNVENASYRLTTCAEQSAIVTAVGQYGPGIKLRAVAVANLNDTASEPCGACRQTILEFGFPDTWVFFPTTRGVAGAAIGEILPIGFVFPR
ncbi:cytidine deaminase [Granulicella arctica]|uniref:Cytidine deaminase n=1 Tax=Granulicella arctica TaxID=940613 RepID=A0A7Y9PGI8_9BACT|nr:cytidine deaminase [Granulicella arctica]NYF79474.1 cytidine deaminase [Granulicella arctica]